MSTQAKIIEVTDSLKKMLQVKNERYGDSAINPLRIFSSVSADESILIRLDDKLSRVLNSEHGLRKNDVADIIGYLSLLCIAKGWTNFDDLID